MNETATNEVPANSTKADEPKTVTNTTTATASAVEEVDHTNTAARESTAKLITNDTDVLKNATAESTEPIEPEKEIDREKATTLDESLKTINSRIIDENA